MQPESGSVIVVEPDQVGEEVELPRRNRRNGGGFRPGVLERQERSTMGARGERIARGIQSFVDHPVTNLLKGLALLMIGFSEAVETVQDDIIRGHARVGHGLIIIGVFSILYAMPRFIEGMDSYRRYLVLRDENGSTVRERRPRERSS